MFVLHNSSGRSSYDQFRFVFHSHNIGMAGRFFAVLIFPVNNVDSLFSLLSCSMFDGCQRNLRHAGKGKVIESTDRKIPGDLISEISDRCHDTISDAVIVADKSSGWRLFL